MNEKVMNQLIEMAIKSAKRINKAYENFHAYNKDESTTITYTVAELDTIMNILCLCQSRKYFLYNRDENYERIKSIEIKEYNKEALNFITIKTIEI